MRIIIIGAGEVGLALTQVLVEKGYNVVLVEQDTALVTELEEQINARVVCADGRLASTLKDVGAAHADYILAMTRNDAANLITCKIAKSMGAQCAIARIHHQTYIDSGCWNYERQLNIDYLINPEALCAMQLARALRNSRGEATQHFARGNIEIQQITAKASSPFLDKPLSILKLPKQIRVGYIRRGGDGQYEIPSAECAIQEGDTIALLGPPELLSEHVQTWKDVESSSKANVVLFSGTETAFGLCSILSNTRFRVKLIEKNKAICQLVAREFPHVTVIHGDGTSLKLLEEEHIESADYFIACSRDDENNVMTSIQSKRLGAKHTQLVVNKVDYEPILQETRSILGIEVAVSPRNVTVNEVLRYIHTKAYSELASIGPGALKIIELTLSREFLYNGKRLKEIPWPPNMLIIALFCNTGAKVPEAEDVIAENDRIILIIKNSQIQAFEQLLGGKKR